MCVVACCCATRPRRDRGRAGWPEEDQCVSFVCCRCAARPQQAFFLGLYVSTSLYIRVLCGALSTQFSAGAWHSGGPPGRRTRPPPRPPRVGVVVTGRVHHHPRCPRLHRPPPAAAARPPGRASRPSTRRHRTRTGSSLPGRARRAGGGGGVVVVVVLVVVGQRARAWAPSSPPRCARCRLRSPWMTSPAGRGGRLRAAVGQRHG